MNHVLVEAVKNTKTAVGGKCILVGWTLKTLSVQNE